MPARFRVALQGFSDLERTTLELCFRLAPTRVPAYEEVDEVSEADFVVADAAAAGIVAMLTRSDRMADAVFVGARAVPGAIAHVRRPIDPIQVVRELDALAAMRGEGPTKGAAAPPPELNDDVTSDLPEPPPPPERDDAGEPTRPYVRVAELDVGPPPDVEVTEMFDLPDIFVPEQPAQAQSAEALPSPSAEVSEEADTPESAATTSDIDLPLNDLGVPEPPAPVRPAASAAQAAPAAQPEPAAQPSPMPQPTAQAATLAPSAPPAPQAETPVWPDAKAHAKARARAAAARRRNASQLVSGGEATLEALVLDDSDIAAQYLGQLLEELGLHVHFATTGAEALDVLTHQPITIAFLDLTLGEGDEFDGLDICQRIKHEPLALGGGSPLVVLVSGQARASDRVRATLAGSDAYMTKPFGKQDLVRVLESCGMTLLPTLTLPVGDRPPA